MDGIPFYMHVLIGSHALLSRSCSKKIRTTFEEPITSLEIRNAREEGRVGHTRNIGTYIHVCELYNMYIA